MVKGGKKYDIVLFGATGFTGGLAAKYLASQYGTKISWAIAGRSKAKLEIVKAGVDNIPDIIVADATDKAAMDAMCKKTVVVATTAGPFQRYGNNLVEACVANGTAYCDITGETDWVRLMVARHDDAARKSGARIVHLCGHDSVPWDLMTLMLAKKLAEGGEKLKKVDMFDSIFGYISGATMETGMIMKFEKEGQAVKEDPILAKLGYDPMLKERKGKSRSELIDNNVMVVDNSGYRPRSYFMMSDINYNAIIRSNALNNYGDNVVYREGMAFPRYLPVPGLLMAAGTSITFGLGNLAMMASPLRWLAKKLILPAPGTDHPPQWLLDNGYLWVTGQAEGTNGTKVQAKMKFHCDAGYKDTARMLVESALTLSLDADKCKTKDGGVYTPAACQGEALLDRLLSTGTDFEYEEC